MRCDVGLQAPLGWKVVQSLSARRIARIWNMHSIFQFPRSRSRVAKDYKIVWAGLCKAGLRWPGVRAKFEINHEGLKRKFQFNSSFYIGRKIIAVVHQSIPAAPSTPPPFPHLGLLRGICPPFQPRGWVFTNFALSGGRHLPTPGLFPSFWHARSSPSEYNYKEDITGKTAD